MQKRAEEVAKQLNEFRQMSSELGLALSTESALRKETELNLKEAREALEQVLSP